MDSYDLKCRCTQGHSLSPVPFFIGGRVLRRLVRQRSGVEVGDKVKADDGAGTKRGSVVNNSFTAQPLFLCLMVRVISSNGF